MSGRRHRIVIVLSLIVTMVMIPPIRAAYADNDLVGGVGDIVTGVLAIPFDVLAGTFNGPPVIGTIGGALHGTIYALSSVTRGLLRLIGVAIPIAEKVAPLIPIFL